MDFLCLLHVFRAQDAPDLPKMAPKELKMAPRTLPRRLPDLQDLRSQDPSKMVQDAFDTAQDEPKTLQEASESRQDRQNDLASSPKLAKMTPRTSQLSFNLESIFTTFLML